MSIAFGTNYVCTKVTWKFKSNFIIKIGRIIKYSEKHKFLFTVKVFSLYLLLILDY